MIIRNAEAADIPAITAIYNWALTDTDLSPVPGPVTEKSRQEWLEGIQADGFPVFVAVSEQSDAGEAGTNPGMVLGFAGYSQLAFDALFPNTVEDTIYVSDAARGMGVGNALLGAVVEHARTNDYVHSIISYIAANNEASLRLHEKHGFAIAGTLFGIGEKQGKKLDLVHLQLLLDGPSHQERTEAFHRARSSSRAGSNAN